MPPSVPIGYEFQSWALPPVHQPTLAVTLRENCQKQCPSGRQSPIAGQRFEDDRSEKRSIHAPDPRA